MSGRGLEDRLRKLEWAPLHERDIDAVARSRTAPVQAVPMAWGTWNRQCRDEGGGEGAAEGWYILIAALTGLGKSILLGNIGWRATLSGVPVAYLSSEMSENQWLTRFWAIVSGLPIWQLERGNGYREESLRRAHADVQNIHRHAGGALYTSPHNLHTVGEVLEAMRFLRETQGVRLFLIDYLQLLTDPNDPAEVTLASRQIRSVTQELGVVTVAASQFNRTTSANRSEPPTVQGLLGASALENDADQIVLLDHSRIERAEAPREGWHGYALLAKNRHGAAAEVPIFFDKSTLRMTERLPDELPALKAA